MREIARASITGTTLNDAKVHIPKPVLLELEATEPPNKYDLVFEKRGKHLQIGLGMKK